MTQPRAAAAPGRLDARVVVHRGDFELAVDLEAEPGEVVAVLGPNGAGKSTLLAVLAGLLVPRLGHVTLGGRTLTDARTALAPEQRRVGLMGQDPLLFPHLSARENIAFGPRSQGVGRTESRRAAGDWLAALGLAEFAGRRPAQLSGGQRQRVALARALAASPELLLLDEPLGALDAETAPEIRQVLGTHIRRAGTTTIVVTHDVLDAAMLADRVVVIADGRVVDTGATARVLAAPRSEFTAAMAGVNLVRATAAAPAAAGQALRVTARASGIAISGIAAEPISSHAAVVAIFPPSAVAVYLAPVPSGSPRNTWPATITALEPGPASIRVRARLARARSGNDVIPGDAARDDDAAVSIAADLTAASVAELGLAPGTRVYLSVKATEVRLHAR